MGCGIACQRGGSAIDTPATPTRSARIAPASTRAWVNVRPGQALRVWLSGGEEPLEEGAVACHRDA